MVEKLTLSGWTRGIGQEEVMETFSSSSPFSSSCSSLVPASSSSRTGLGLPLGKDKISTAGRDQGGRGEDGKVEGGGAMGEGMKLTVRKKRKREMLW